MGAFFASLFDEMGARRRRLRASLGDRGQGVAEFLVLAGLLIGSLGLFVREWMPGAAPWGFAVPFVFIAGYLLFDARRQASASRAAAPEKVATRYDWIVLLWSLACALAGAAAFVIAWSAAPEAPVDPNDWAPPENAIDVEISP